MCDDLTIEIDASRSAHISPACPLASQFFERALGAESATDFQAARVAGQAVSLDVALAAASKLLSHAQRTLVYGLAQATTEDARAAVELAEALRGTIDTHHLPLHNAAAESLQTVGLSTASLGEVRHYCDLVIYWGCDPVVDAPRHLERYSLHERSRFVPGGRGGKTLVVIDSVANETAAAADLSISIARDQNERALLLLRMLVAGQAISPETTNAFTPELLAQLVTLAERMKACRAGIVFFGERILGESNTSEPLQSLSLLARELHQVTRFYARRMRGAGDILAADQVLAWQTGFSRAIDFAAGFPQYEPVDHSAALLLERGEVDTVVLVGSASVGALPAAAQAHLARCQQIAIDPVGSNGAGDAAVQIMVAAPGVQTGGTAYRMDEMAIPLLPLVSSSLPTTHQVLASLTAALKATSNT